MSDVIGLEDRTLSSPSGRSSASVDRFSALGAGDLVTNGLREVRAVRKETDGDLAAASKIAIARLREFGAITASDVRRLESLTYMIHAAGGRNPSLRMIEEIQASYDAMVDDPDASPTALAIVSIIASLSTQTEVANRDGQVVFTTSKAQDRGASTVLVLIGAAIGSAVGGGAGGVIGGIAGGLVAEACD